MKILLSHIKELLQVRNNAPDKVSGAEMKNLPTLKNAWLLLEG
jgi:imidazolonepropionase